MAWHGRLVRQIEVRVMCLNERTGPNRRDTLCHSRWAGRGCPPEAPVGEKCEAECVDTVGVGVTGDPVGVKVSKPWTQHPIF